MVCSAISVKIVGLRGKEAKYSPEFKLDAIMMYINSMGIRAIGRVKKGNN